MPAGEDEFSTAARTGEVEGCPACRITELVALFKFRVPVNVGIPSRSENICPKASQSFSISACSQTSHFFHQVEAIIRHDVLHNQEMKDLLQIQHS